MTLEERKQIYLDEYTNMVNRHIDNLKDKLVVTFGAKSRAKILEAIKNWEAKLEKFKKEMEKR